MNVVKSGELARRGGVNLQTLRYYERECLLRQPPRTAAGYRLYTEGDLQQLIFIKECQRLGFTLEEIKILGGLHHNISSASMTRISAIATERVRLIDEKIAALESMRERLLSLCQDTKASSMVCPAARMNRH
jgi:DNA-binding transcriptional MerR regulator